jgi:hypothetical protein
VQRLGEGGGRQLSKFTITHYEQHMRQRAAAVARDTIEQTAALHAPEGLAHLVELFSRVGPGSEVA